MDAMKHLMLFVIISLCCIARTAGAGAGAMVTLDDQGFFRINAAGENRGTVFFPIGCWVYGMNPAILAELQDHHFNTVVRWGFTPTDLPTFEAHGMMALAPPTPEFLKLKNSPALLGWYLEDEPEEHGIAPSDLMKRYMAVKAQDPRHPIGVTHDTLHGPAVYAGCSDFTMTDVYPVTADRSWPLGAVGMYTDRPRELHGKSWTNLTFVQTFGGPNTDGGIWAQPLPHEVRFMVFNALVHRANGILYFSYWPQAPATWAEVGKVNRQIERLVPWLVSPGQEMPVSATEMKAPGPARKTLPSTAPTTAPAAVVEVRARKIGRSWLIIATNMLPRPVDVTMRVPAMATDGTGATGPTLQMPFEPGCTIAAPAGAWRAHFTAYEAQVWLAGPEPTP
jgi:hypothetical protein